MGMFESNEEELARLDDEIEQLDKMRQLAETEEDGAYVCPVTRGQINSQLEQLDEEID